MTHLRFDTIEQCEAAARDVASMPTIKDRLRLAGEGRTVFRFDHVCSGGASKHQGSE